MKILKHLNSEELASSLKNGEVSILPTDTIYGIVGLANSKKAIDRIYKLKGRNLNKLFIVLISSLDDLNSLDIKLDTDPKKIINKYWPGKVSIVFKRKKDTLAVRFPNFLELTELIKKTGPLAAPSANPEGLATAKNIKEAQNYFGDKVDYYIDWGNLDSLPSTLIKLENGKAVVLRKGAVTIDESDKAF